MHHMPEYNHAPPRHIPPSMQHIKPKPKRTRKVKPPASLSKLHRPLTRFYCNDCKKKFRSRILANRNNNAVQHYCSLYSKIITRKVDSHSNKCKGDHGMGPCVVKRTDLDPDSDGEDETKAAYYADKGKAPRSTRKPRGAYTKSDKKRKRSVVNDNGYDDHPQAKRARTSSDPSYVAGGPPPVEPMGYYTNLPPQHHGYYNQNGYMTPENGIARPSYNNAIPPPPPIDDYNESSLPPPPIIESKSENGQSRSPPARIPMPLLSGENNHNGIESMNGDIPPSTEYAIGMNGGQNNEQEESGPPPPPPPLEEFAPLPVDNGVNGNGVHDKNKKADKNNEEAKQEENVDIITMETTTTTKGNDNVEQKEEIQTISFDKVCNNKAESMVELNGQNGHKTQNNAPNTTDTGNNKNNNNEQQSMDDEDCINVGSDDDDLPDLTVPNSSPSPSAKHKKAFSLSTNGNEEQQQAEDEDDDLILSLP